MKFIQTNNALKPNGHYSQAVVHGDFMFISCQLSTNPETGDKELGDPKEEAKRILGNIDLILREAGINKNHVLKATIYVADISYWSQIDCEYKLYFGDHKPARSVISSPNLHFGCNVEMEFIACMTIDN